MTGVTSGAMKSQILWTVAGLVSFGAFVACDETKPAQLVPGNAVDTDAGGASDGRFSYCKDKTSTEISFTPGQEQQALDALNTLAECTTVKFAAGTFKFNNALTIRQKGITIIGAGKGAKGGLTGDAASTVLEFSAAAANTNGIDHQGDWFTIRDLAIVDAKKDGLRVEQSTNVRIQSLRAEWSVENASTNGAYGLYPVKSTNVLVEKCEAYNASDAGIYVGQVKNTIVRDNVAKQNVAGIEIENTDNADVYGNDAEDNTAGLAVFDLTGNPIKGTDIFVHDNIVRGNNRANFGGGVVGGVPAGTGTFILASRRVELAKNTYGNNVTVDVSIVSGLDIEPDVTQWAAGGNNWGISDIWVHDNTFEAGSGINADNGHVDIDKRPLGALLSFLYGYGSSQGVDRIEPVVWDGVDLQPQADNLLNDVNVCVGNNTLPADAPNAIVDLNLPASQALATSFDLAGAWAKTARYAQGAAPFNCSGFTPALVPVTLPE